MTSVDYMYTVGLLINEPVEVMQSIIDDFAKPEDVF